MRKLITLFAAMLVASLAFGQQHVTTPDLGERLQPLAEDRYLEAEKFARPSNGTGITAPAGTVSGSAVTAIKIAEASNAYTSIQSNTNQVHTVPSLNAVAFLNRQNIQDCGGAPGNGGDNGRYRYSISIDGGLTWNIGGNGGTFVPPAFNGCYGIGTITPTYTRPTRYPNVNLFLRGGGTTLDSLTMVYTGPTLQANGNGFDGSIVGTLLSPADSANNYNLSQEEYYNIGGSRIWTHSLYTQIDSRNGTINFWYGSRGWDGTEQNANMYLHKGTYNPNTKKVVWATPQSLNLPYYLGFDGTGRASSFTVAFSPNGQHGWIGMVGDLTGGSDTVYQPIFIHSDDYGDTWGSPVEININDFPELVDTLILGSPDAIFVDSAGNPVDTTKFGLGKGTTAFNCDMEVDANGNPHMLVLVGNATNVTSTSAGYSISSGLGMYLFDVTKDAFGDWNMLYISRQATFRGEFGDPSVTSGSWTEDAYVQVTRSEDGTKIFYSWNDTDTTGVGGSDNNQPDLLGRAWDLSANKLTAVVNWTSNDLDWATKAIVPKTANAALQSGTVFKVPTVVISLDNNTAIDPVSFWYFQDVEYDTDTDFNDDPIFFYNCKENPFANTPTINSASCALNNDGSASINTGGGVSPYAFLWDTGNAGDTTATLDSLAAGVYTAYITDDKGCVDTVTAIVNNVGAPSAGIVAGSVTNPTCFGSTNGTATVAASGGSGGTTFMWSNGETTAAATMLAAGVNTVTVTDMAGCSSFETVTLSQPPAIVLDGSGTDVTCWLDGDGSATVTLATGGAGGFNPSSGTIL